MKNALVAQRLEQRTHNPLVVGSSPSERTIDELRQLGKWPFPKWEDGRIVPVRVKKPPAYKPSWDNFDEALF
jgi:hypothetical protein